LGDSPDGGAGRRALGRNSDCGVYHQRYTSRVHFEANLKVNEQTMSDLNYPFCQQRYQAALVELDSQQVLELIHAAEVSILVPRQQIAGTLDGEMERVATLFEPGEFLAGKQTKINNRLEPKHRLKRNATTGS